MLHTIEKHGLVPKVLNSSPTAQRKPMVKLISIDICFYEIFIKCLCFCIGNTLALTAKTPS